MTLYLLFKSYFRFYSYEYFFDWKWEIVSNVCLFWSNTARSLLFFFSYHLGQGPRTGSRVYRYCKKMNISISTEQWTFKTSVWENFFFTRKFHFFFFFFFSTWNLFLNTKKILNKNENFMNWTIWAEKAKIIMNYDLLLFMNFSSLPLNKPNAKSVCFSLPIWFMSFFLRSISFARLNNFHFPKKKSYTLHPRS